jgi:hypothetical protein
MSNASDFDTLIDRYELILESIEILKFDMGSLVDLLDATIEAEEEYFGIFDPSDSNYPVEARVHRSRRDNLVAAISQPSRERGRLN